MLTLISTPTGTEIQYQSQSYAPLFEVRWQSSDLSILETTPTLNWLTSSTESGVSRTIPTTASTSPIIFTSTSNGIHPTNRPPPSRGSDTGLSTGFVVGISIGAAFLALFFIAVVVAMFRIRRRHSRVHKSRSQAHNGSVPEIGGSYIYEKDLVTGIYEKDSTLTAEMDTQPISSNSSSERGGTTEPSQSPPQACFSPLELASHADEMSVQKRQGPIGTQGPSTTRTQQGLGQRE